MSKLKFENETGKGKFNNFTKGFYIALSFCMVAAAGVAWATFSDNIAPPMPIEENSTASYVSSVPEIPEKEAENIISGIPAQTPKAPESKAESAAPSASVFMMPVSGEIMNEFSSDQLIYSVTMSDWRTHDGVDIKCEKGSQIKAVNNGEVLSIKEDPYLGYVFEIKHGAFTVYYCGMSKTTHLKKGSLVKIGDVIGITDNIPSECLEESHFHMAVKQNGKYVDPLLALGLGE